jgi:hypothetical protein
MDPGSLWISAIAQPGGMAADGPVDGRWLDDASKNFFAVHGDRGSAHAQTYAAYGALGGYAEQSNTPLEGLGFGPFTGAMWLGTVYPTGQTAARMAAETVATLQAAGYPAAPCGGSVPDCRSFDFTWTDGRNEKHDALYGIEIQGQAVGEFAFDAYADDMQTRRSTLLGLFSQVAASAHAVLSGATGTSPSGVSSAPLLNGAHPQVGVLSVVPLRFDRGAVDFSVNGGVAYLTGTDDFDTIAQLGNPRSYPVSAVLSIFKGARAFATVTMNPSGGAPEGRVFSVQVHFKTKAWLGKFTVSATVKMAGLSSSKSTTLVVKQLRCRPGKVVKQGRCVKKR